MSLHRTLQNIEQKNIRNAKVAIISTLWNDAIIAELMAGCKAVLEQYNVAIVKEAIAPGAFEIPYCCKSVWEALKNTSQEPDVMIAFGAVIKGGTPHFDYVCQGVVNGITQLNLSLPVATVFGVLTLDSEAQAWERLGGTHGHKGQEAAYTALHLVDMKRSL
ncbi:MAG: 6,7-dimethyl-8-ribityllumazine synthase [Chitinophagia bacterium]|nr:6,7-dimethyl-8-ribityllumazine synthase [Chitinophagia bacterium]